MPWIIGRRDSSKSPLVAAIRRACAGSAPFRKTLAGPSPSAQVRASRARRFVPSSRSCTRTSATRAPGKCARSASVIQSGVMSDQSAGIGRSDRAFVMARGRSFLLPLPSPARPRHHPRISSARTRPGQSTVSHLVCRAVGAPLVVRCDRSPRGSAR